jgi:NAD(P)-dependent dehydrogenase (short-subunit alcohol dehydrogenase family)
VRTAVVTGAGGGIGRAIVLGLGADLILVGRDPDRLTTTAELLGHAGVESHGIALDVTEPDAPERIVRAALDATATLDVLVNCAGVNHRRQVEHAHRNDYDHSMSVDVKAPFFLAQAALEPMREARLGSIINIGSLPVSTGVEDSAVYGIAKAGLAQLTRSLAVEVRHLRANCICPGFFSTPLTTRAWNDPERATLDARSDTAGTPRHARRRDRNDRSARLRRGLVHHRTDGVYRRVHGWEPVGASMSKLA